MGHAAVVKRTLVCLLFLLNLVCLLPAQAYSLQEAQTEVAGLVAGQRAPEGVVFEIISRNKDILQTALPAIQYMVAQLRDAYPDLDIAVVSHGPEQFALTRENAASHQASHQAVQSLRGGNVNVHVCGAYADYKGVSAEAFPEYVDVAAHGPSLIKDYIDLGYRHIKIKND